MNAETSVRISKIRAYKEKKTGAKRAEIELTQPVGDNIEGPLALAVEQMKDNPAVEKISLSLTLEAHNLSFFVTERVGKPVETIKAAELRKFRLRREATGVELSYQFETSLEVAKRWIIPAIGDDVMVIVEPAQRTMEAGAN